MGVSRKKIIKKKSSSYLVLFVSIYIISYKSIFIIN